MKNSSSLGHAHPRAFNCSSEVIAVAGWTPDTVVTSREIEETLAQINPKFSIDIQKLTGVRERRVASPQLSIVDMAISACSSVFKKANASPKDIDTVIFSSVCRTFFEPATATLICNQLGVVGANAFDVTNACLGFVDAWMIADAFIQSGRSRLVLVVGAEKSSYYWKMALDHLKKDFTQITDLVASFTLGDGSAAMLVGPPQTKIKALNIKAGIRASYGAYSELCVLRDSNTPMRTNPRALFSAALKRSPPLLRELLTHLNWKPGDVDLVIPHQASYKVMEGASALMDIPVEKAHLTLDRFGNMASVSVPFTLAEAIHKNKFHSSHKMIVLGYGSGLGVGLLAATMNHS